MQKTIVPCAAFDRAAAQKVLRQVLQKPDSTLCLATATRPPVFLPGWLN